MLQLSEANEVVVLRHPHPTAYGLVMIRSVAYFSSSLNPATALTPIIGVTLLFFLFLFLFVLVIKLAELSVPTGVIS